MPSPNRASAASGGEGGAAAPEPRPTNLPNATRQKQTVRQGIRAGCRAPTQSESSERRGGRRRRPESLPHRHPVAKRRNGGEAGIRTLGRGLSPFNGLANRRLQPLGHLTASEESLRYRTPAGRFHPHRITHSSCCGPDKYSTRPSGCTSVSSSRRISTSWPSHSGTGTVTENSSEIHSPARSGNRGWSP